MKTRYLLILIVGLGFLLRIYQLGGESLWLDEGYSAKMAQLSLGDMVQQVISDDNHPPLYYALLHGWVLLLGRSEFALRLLSVVFGTLSIFVCYSFCSVCFNRKTALYATLLLAVSVFHIEFSREARVYALMVLLALLNLWFLVQLDTHKRPAVFAGYLVSAFLLIHCHVYALFIFLAQNVWVAALFCQERRSADRSINLKKWLLLQFLLLLSFLPWLTILLRQMARALEWYWMSRPPLAQLWFTLTRYVGGDYYTHTLLIVVLLLLSLNGLLVFRFSPLTLRSSDRRSKLLLVLCFFLPILIPFLISQLSTPIFQIKSTIVASVPLFILAAHGITNITKRRLQAAVLSLVVILSAVNLYYFHRAPQKEQWRQLAARIESQAHPDDAVLFVANYCSGDVYDYYADRTDIARLPFPPCHITSNITPDNIDSLTPLIAPHRRIWLVLSHDTYHDPDRLVLKTITDSYHLTDHQKLRGIELYLFQQPAPSPAQIP